MSEQNTSHGSRQLNALEQARIQDIRAKAAALRLLIYSGRPAREQQIAAERVDEAEMWAVKAVVAG